VNTAKATTDQLARGTESKVIVVGAGAMGSLFASRFARAGCDTWVYDVWPEDVERIRKFGLTDH